MIHETTHCRYDVKASVVMLASRGRYSIAHVSVFVVYSGITQEVSQLALALFSCEMRKNIHFKNILN